MTTGIRNYQNATELPYGCSFKDKLQAKKDDQKNQAPDVKAEECGPTDFCEFGGHATGCLE